MEFTHPPVPKPVPARKTHPIWLLSQFKHIIIFFSPCNSSFFLFIDWMLASILSHSHHRCNSSEPKTHLEGNRRENLLVFPITIIPSFLNDFNNTVQVSSWKHLLCCCQLKTPVGRTYGFWGVDQKVPPTGNLDKTTPFEPKGTAECVDKYR